MSTDAFAKMAEYFESLVQEMKSEARQAGLLQNPTAVGTGREEIFRRLLERHLPDNCEVFRGGYVFNVEGETSRQIDVVEPLGNSHCLASWNERVELGLSLLRFPIRVTCRLP